MKGLPRMKRIGAFMLAVVLCVTSLGLWAYGEERVPLIRRFNIFSGRTFTVFGKSHNSMGYYQEGLEGDAMPTFCLEPGKRMPNGEQSTYVRYEARQGESIPGIGPAERFAPMTLAYEWMQNEGNMRDGVRYGVVQTYLWGCMAGYEDDWEAQEDAARVLAGILGDQVMAEYYDMAAFIQEGMEEFGQGGGGGLPAWSGTSQKMNLEDGVYSLTLDISACPQLRQAAWTLPDSDWTYQAGDQEITFYYKGAQAPAGEIRSSEIPGLEGGGVFYAYIFTPGGESSFQKQMGRFAHQEEGASAWFTVGAVAAPEETLTFETFRHQETFEADYTIELEKYCAETNQPLEGSVFQVWEDFDQSQLSGRDYEEGEPDGRTGRLYNNAMEPLLSGPYACAQITTDQEGYASHRDKRYYHYSKTYCTGHPAPVWLEVPEPEYDETTGECTNEEEIEAVEAENERLRGIWMAQQEMCEETCDFHVGNEDEDNRELDYSAQEEMLSDREETYEKFIHLSYTYWLEEKTARTGYILHGLHSGDQELERVTVESAQAGGGIRGRAAYNSGEQGAENSVARTVENGAEQTMANGLAAKLLGESIPEASPSVAAVGVNDASGPATASTSDAADTTVASIISSSKSLPTRTIPVPSLDLELKDLRRVVRTRGLYFSRTINNAFLN